MRNRLLVREGVQERLRIGMVGEKGALLSVSIMTTSPWSDRMGEEQLSMPPLLEEESSSSIRLRFISLPLLQ